ncbi:MAG: CCA tRNA nucleotidyltransferase [Alkalispirochaetaceae bacterium]
MNRMHRSIKPLIPFARRFRDAGRQLYLVGGAVRNLELGREPVDFDFATDATPREVMGLFRRVLPTGVQHGTVTVLYKGAQYEVTTFRTESDYSDGRHPDSVEFASTIEEDLGRRDFTINAMAIELPSGELSDPYDGRGDLRGKIVRALGDPKERFHEDGLRVLRAVRFAAQLDFQIEENTFAAMRIEGARLSKVARERVRDELEKAILSNSPARAMRLLRDAQLLPYTIPELAKTIGRSQGSDSDYDLFEHSVLVTQFVPPKVELRLAALFHDVAKAWTLEETEDGRLAFPDHDRQSAEVAEERLKELRFPNRTVEYAAHLVRHHMFGYNSEYGDAALRRMLARIGKETIWDLITLRRADVAGKRGKIVPVPEMDELQDRLSRILAERSALTRGDLAVNGNDLMKEAGIPPGPALGQVLDLLLEAVFDDPEMNEREQLLRLARNIYRERIAR